MAYKDEPSLYPKNCISGLDWEQVHKMIDDAMEKRDRTVSIYINPDGGMSSTRKAESRRTISV